MNRLLILACAVALLGVTATAVFAGEPPQVPPLSPRLLALLNTPAAAAAITTAASGPRCLGSGPGDLMSLCTCSDQQSACYSYCQSIGCKKDNFVCNFSDPCNSTCSCFSCIP